MKSLKKLFVAGLALSLPLAALAQAAAPAPAVTVYGTFNVNLQYTEASDATAGADADVSPRTGVSIDSTNVGVRAAHDIAFGMKALAQCETQASIDGLDLRSLCNRNSRVGVSGNFGTIFLGNWDTPYKALAYGTKADDPFGNTDVFGFQGIFGSPGYGVRSTAFTTAATPNAGFDVRAGNSVAYWSPKFSGLSFKVQYGTNESRSADGVVDPQLVAAGVNFDLAGLSVGAGAEYHEDLYGIRTINGANTGRSASKDLGLKLAAGYELPLGVGALTVMGMIEQLSYQQEEATTGYEDYSRLAWLLGAKFRTGAHEFRARYSQAMDPDVTAAPGVTAVEDDLGAQHYALGYAYHAAKNVQLYAFFTQILNDDAARYTFGVSGAAAVLANPAGSDPLATGVGIRYAF